jgi:sulfur carrier protein
MFQTRLPNNVGYILCQLLAKSSAQLVPKVNIGSVRRAGTQREALHRPLGAGRVTLRCRLQALGFCYFVFMRLVINAEERNLAASTLDALIEELGMKGDRVAVELNREIVPRQQWSATALHDGDRLEIVHFVGGGSS